MFWLLSFHDPGHSTGSRAPRAT
eukprot:SAG11_NODE_37545_length_256_cov_0.987261_1_plen_22_part_10